MFHYYLLYFNISTCTNIIAIIIIIIIIIKRFFDLRIVLIRRILKNLDLSSMRVFFVFKKSFTTINDQIIITTTTWAIVKNFYQKSARSMRKSEIHLIHIKFLHLLQYFINLSCHLNSFSLSFMYKFLNYHHHIIY